MSSKLESLRAAIDQIDEQLIALLGRRFAITAEVGRMKASQAMPPVDVEREEAQRRKYARLAAGHGVKEDLVQSLFRSVIEQVVLNHRAIREQ